MAGKDHSANMYQYLVGVRPELGIQQGAKTPVFPQDTDHLIALPRCAALSCPSSYSASNVPLRTPSPPQILDTVPLGHPKQEERIFKLIS